MEFPKDIINLLTPDQIKIVAGVSLGLLSSAGAFVLSFIVKSWVGMRKDINHMKTNCLPTIQKNTGKTVELLEELVKEQHETNGFLRGETSGFLRGKLD